MSSFSRCRRSLLSRSRLPLLFAAVALLTACPTHPTDTKEKQTDEPSRALAPGETVTHRFAADGLWHRSPYLALNEHQLVIRPAGDAAGLSEQALRFRIASVPQMVNAGKPFAVTMPGRIAFRLDPKFAREIEGDAAVEIQRLK